MYCQVSIHWGHGSPLLCPDLKEEEQMFCTACATWGWRSEWPGGRCPWSCHTRGHLPASNLGLQRTAGRNLLDQFPKLLYIVSFGRELSQVRKILISRRNGSRWVQSTVDFLNVSFCKAAWSTAELPNQCYRWVTCGSEIMMPSFLGVAWDGLPWWRPLYVPQCAMLMLFSVSWHAKCHVKMTCTSMSERK